MQMDSMNNIQVKTDGRVATVVIDRAESLNALTKEVLMELRTALLKLEDVSVVVLTGAGSKAFVAGADIKEMSQMSALEARTFAELGQGVVQLIEEAPYVTVAAVNGFALGGGLELALACDLIYSSEKVKMGLPETNLGIVPGFGGTVNLLQRVGFGRAMEMILSGRTVDAAEAKSMGLVLENFPDEGFLTRVQQEAKALSEKGIYSLLAARRLVRSVASIDKERSLLLERESFGNLFATHEPKEGMQAFLEKRKPQFYKSH